MADIPADLDITVDLNGQSADVQPYHGDAVPMNQQPAPTVTPEKADDKPAPSLRDTLTDAFKGETAPKVEQPAEAAPAAPQATGDRPDLVKVGERFHRKDGSFASKEEIDAFNAPVAEGGQQPPVVPAWASNLTELERTQLASLPAETRQFVERTMEGVNQRSAQLQEYDMIEQVIGPRREPWSQNGMTPLVAINELLALSDFAGRDPGEFVMWFANQHQLDLDAMLDARDEALQNGEQMPAYVTGLQQQIAQLQNTIGGLTSTTVQQTTAQNMRHVQQFIEEKDASGNLAHPYFNDVATQVAQHVQLIRQQQPYLPERDILKAAYDFATFNNPEIRGKMQADTLKAQQDAAAAEAARARAAGVSINGGPAGDSSQAPNNANRTLREELQHAYSQNTLQ
jgi:hypothetical protein